MNRKKILVVDDEEDIRKLLFYNLSREGYDVECTETGEDALTRVRSHGYELVVLDLMLPGINGLDVFRAMKAEARTARIPVLMLTARGDDVDVVAGLELGADDYVTKPFSPRVLTARIRALLRRYEEVPEDPDKEELITRHNLVINTTKHEVLVDGVPVDLTATEFALLAHLARRPGWVFTRTRIIDAVKGDNCAVTDRSVDVQVVGLRRKLGGAGDLVETVRGVGYRFKE
jgi:two-component system phosphate regulon response regulator PhoB